ncbi:hypothetical protein P7K49_029199 [Saguinus oedipus]|uniref:Uncharacterized protein n=1 Tax=Saguinus oedipus TaxID=9490 RepID=A0ABQ9U7C1_SAGOE|nr:hypothetical protein P7K49_029199 [Saguinus oedipus]
MTAGRDAARRLRQQLERNKASRPRQLPIQGRTRTLRSGRAATQPGETLSCRSERGAPDPDRSRRRPITGRRGRERLEGAGSRGMTAPRANGKIKWESEPAPLTNGNGVAVAEVPTHALAAGSAGRGWETLGLKGTLEGSLLVLSLPPAGPQTTARSSPAGSVVCPVGKEVHRSRR